MKNLIAMAIVTMVLVLLFLSRVEHDEEQEGDLW